jgi:two-component system response regulator AtoC
MSMIMIVDDTALVREPIAATFRLAGHEALCAANGQEALAVLRKQTIDLVVLDLGMPVLDGLGMLRLQRAEPAIANIPVILLTEIADTLRIVSASGQLDMQPPELLHCPVTLDRLHDFCSILTAKKTVA